MSAEKKTLSRLIALALMTFTGSAALAQSSVQIYGRLNTSLEHQKVGGASVTGLFNNNSRFGFIGTEDLGGGLRAGFVLEAGFQSDTGAGMQADGGLSFGRKAQVYLSGKYGKLTMGRAGGSSYDFVADYGVLDQPNHDTGTISDPIYDFLIRATNAITYTSPNINGLTLVTSVSMHEKEAGSNDKNSYDVSANWGRGPISVGAGYTKTGLNEQAGLRAQYTSGPFQIGAYYQRSDNGSGSMCNISGNNAGGGCGTRNAARVTAMYTMGASEFTAGFGWAGRWSHVNASSARQFTMGYNYNLSLRTKLYAAYTKISNQDNVRYGYGFKNGVAYGQDASTFVLGLRHAF